MKKPIPLFCCLILFFLFTQSLYCQDWLQAKRYSAPVGLNDVDNSGIAVAPDSSIYLVGTMRGTVQFDEVTATVTDEGPSNDHSYVLKLNAALQAQWVVTYEDDTDLADVATDPAGNLVVVGSVQEGNLTYIAKYDKEGNLLHELVSTGGNSYAKVAKVGEQGSYYVGGWMNQPTAFNGTIPAVNTQGRESYLLKLDANLNVVWATLTGASSQLDEIHGIAFDGEGFVYTSGNYSQSFSIGCFCWNGDFFVEKRSAATGNVIWTKILTGGSGTATEMYLLVDSNTNVVSVAAAFKNTTSFGNGISLSTSSGNDDYHLFTARLNSANGNVQAAAKLTTTGDAYIKGMVRYENALHLYGYFVGILTVDESPYIPMSRDAFHLVIDPTDHEPEFAEIFTGSNLETGMDIDAGAALVTSGLSTSSTMYIDTFALPGTSRSIYLATTFSEALPCAIGIMINLLEPVSCYGDENGQVQALPAGGTGPYTYHWETGETTATIGNLAPGTYFVTITDANGCSTSGAAMLEEPQPLEVDLNTIDNACNETMNGMAVANVTGGTAPYTIHWSTGATGSTLGELPAGNYEVTVTDDRGCETISTLSIGSESYEPDLEIVQLDNGLNVTEENAFYQWLDCLDGNIIEGATEQLFLPNATGEYAVIVSNGICADTSDCFSLALVAAEEVNGETDPAQIFPNPNTGVFTLYLPEAGEVEVLGVNGQRISRTFYSSGNHQFMLQELPTGSYWIRIQSNSTRQTLRWIKQ